MMIIDKLAYSSRLRYKSPFLKFAFSVGALLICVGARSFAVSFIILLMMGCLTVFYSRTSFSRYCRLMIAPFAFLAMGTVAIAVNYTAEPMDLFSVSIGTHYLAVSWYSLLYALRLIAVSLASVSCLYFLTLTTPMLDILTVLKRLHCPWIIIELMMLIYRYIFVLLDMGLAVTTAQNCRLGNRDLKTSIDSVGQMLSVLLVRALSKSSLLFDAMESRCYDGQIRVLDESRPAQVKEWLAVAAALLLLLLAAAVCRYNGGI